jgi:hypothetical protein
MVKVVDLSSLIKTLMEKQRELDKAEVNNETGTLTGMIFEGSQWGYIETPRGIYALCIEGVGPHMPITETRHVEICIYPEYEDDMGRKTMTIIPTLRARLKLSELLALPVVETKNLADFIRVFGSRLEENYETWREEMTSKIVSDGH